MKQSKQVRQTSVQITAATDHQVKSLQKRGHGSFTDIARIAIDRMYRDELGKGVQEHQEKQ